jgi:hypothetical protein
MPATNILRVCCSFIEASRSKSYSLTWFTMPINLLADMNNAHLMPF